MFTLRINGSMGAAIDDLKEAKKFKSDFVSEANTSPKVDHEKLLGCYEEWWDGQQKEAWNTRYLGSTRARLIGSLVSASVFLLLPGRANS